MLFLQNDDDVDEGDDVREMTASGGKVLVKLLV